MKLITKKDCKFPKRKKHSHKGEAGHLFIIGGSEEFVGAPILSALGAFKAGADLVTIIAPKKVAWTINTYNPSIMTHKLNCKSFSEKQIPIILKLTSKASAVLIGNGIGRNQSQKIFVRKILKKINKPIVIDADAIYSAFFKEIKAEQFIITPHNREFQELTKNNGKKIIEECSEDKVIIKKGSTDIITSNSIYQNRTGVPEMSIAGTGDILAGVAAGFLAQKMSSKQASINATWLCGRAGEKAHKKLGNFTAEEMIQYLKF